ncbi:MAG TPA: hypothetical protein VKN63_10045, partial [Afifellaceae bacterium]|nr:hypothetical protein [Afifellaceae bacterium]
MRNALFSSVAFALAVSGTSAIAADIPEAVSYGPGPVAPALITEFVVEGWGGVAFILGENGNPNPNNTTLGDFGGNARFSLPFGQAFSVQLDAYGEITTNGGDNDNFDNALTGAAHLSWRDPQMGLFGVFGGWGLHESDGTDGDHYFVGLEGQYYSGNWTFYGQGGFMDAESDQGTADDAFHDAFFARAVARYFPTADSRFQGELSFAHGEQDSNDRDQSNIGWGLRYDRGISDIFPTVPATVFVGYRGGYFDNGSGDGGCFSDHTFLAGFRMTFGGGSPDMLT